MIPIFLLLTVAAFAESGPAISPGEALAKLKDGNERYVQAHATHPHQDARLRTALANAQHPFAAIVSCSDSRVPPEIVFDEGLGDLFIVRVAGNILDDAVEGSLEYAVEHLGVRLVVILGHKKCGAVDATLKGGEPGTHIQALVRALSVPVRKVNKSAPDAVDQAVSENVRYVVSQLQSSEPILFKEIRSGHIEVVGAVYDLESGKVEFQH